MDEDRLSPELGRLIDAAKTAAAEQAGVPTPRAEGWAVLVGDGTVHAGPDVAAVLSVAQAGAASSSGDDTQTGLMTLLAAAFAVFGEGGDTLLPSDHGRAVLSDVDPGLPVVVKLLGRWVAVPLSELPPA